ncbi:peptide/nickel transport system ATP-binding protein [Candidatus Nanopelagicus abundans]|uniref:Peptide/nickel transport system ATP-binding protein n=1 Tax=Candidatus Nanopelagicus abundans TaxID=1884916 RepID=A0A249L3D4_9ACTN|nr:ABC transporter ATP-binding protein [Candidatus Nanopelagicus abundans]ASY23600.1 peptide/nickel transport system ATP-binding protein [Candidatus Nanopelagicus abundans]
MSNFLEVKNLCINFPTDDGLVKAVDNLSFSVEKGKTLGLVGESGSGKSVTSLAILGLHKGSRAQVSGQIFVGGVEINAGSESDIRKLRGKQMAMIFQDSLTALNPFYTIGDQIIEAYQVHNNVSKAEAKKHAIDMLDRVGIAEPQKRADDYPHQFSGGMRQRAMIAMALSCDPSLLIADEPTTALDVTVQAQILELLRQLQKDFGTAIILITHDLGVVAETTDDVLLMYAGKAVEYGSVRDVLAKPQHPYGWGLLTSIPRLTGDPDKRLAAISGMPPSMISVPSGCAFHPRCSYQSTVGPACLASVPQLLPVSEGDHHLVRCHLDVKTRVDIFNNQVAPKL